MSTTSTVLHGTPVGSGWAMGEVIRVAGARPLAVAELPDSSPSSAQARVTEAFEAVAASLDRRAQTASTTARDILAATALIARDTTLRAAVAERIAAGSGPVSAVAGGAEQVASRFTALGGYLAERAVDVRDVGNRVAARLLGAADDTLPTPDRPAILVADDIAPVDAAGLDPDLVQAVVLLEGSARGHTAVVIAQLGIPLVLQTPGAAQLETGTRIAVDADAGTVTVDPDAKVPVRLQQRSDTLARATARRRGPGHTKDDRPVALLANIATVRDARAAAAADAEGVGLFRTEMAFLRDGAPPDVAQQQAMLVEVLSLFGERPVVVRTFDAGADKPFARGLSGNEPNPALGVRGVRLVERHPQLLTDQLDALAAAVRQCSAQVSVMAPMIATPAEARWFADQAHEHDLPRSGVMLEVPAAVLRTSSVLEQVEFGSLGTNDLAQYTMAADRAGTSMAPLLDPWQPALLDLIDMAGRGAEAAGRPLGACGASSGDPLMACVLVGSGVSSLSMPTRRIPLIRYAVSSHTLHQCQEMAAAARAASTAQEARRAVERLAAPALRKLS